MQRCLLLFLVGCPDPGAVKIPPVDPDDPMCIAAAEVVDAASALFAALDDEQRQCISFELDDEERYTWSNLPPLSTPREGLPLSAMSEEQRRLAQALIAATLSAKGEAVVEGIITIEAELAAAGDPLADGDLYYFGLFEEPSMSAPWGWQLDGHHLAMSFTAIGCIHTMTPTLYGVNPRTTAAGVEPLADKVSLAEALISSLTQAQLAEATLDIEPALVAGPGYSGGLSPAGLPVVLLDTEQLALLDALIEAYVYDQEGAFADWKMAEVQDGYDQTSIGWVGRPDGSADIYYRIHGPDLLIEFDHTDASREHIHAVYRDSDGDYGADYLADHYRRAH